MKKFSLGLLKILSDPFFEERIGALILFHFLLPFGSLELPIDLHQVLEVIKCKYPASFIDDEERKEV
jgi:hypothetical protein